MGEKGGGNMSVTKKGAACADDHFFGEGGKLNC